jgi:Uma2 family endonuclease
MVAEPQFLSAREFMQLPESPYPVELIDGVVIVSPAPMPRHQLIATRLAQALDEIEQTQGGGMWFSAPIDVFISRNSVFEPDATLFSADNVPDLDIRPVMEIPTIVVEILSPSSRSRDNVRKRAGYSDRGIPEYWIIDPETSGIVFNIANPDGNYLAHELAGDTIPVGRYAGVTLNLDRIFVRTSSAK